MGWTLGLGYLFSLQSTHKAYPRGANPPQSYALRRCLERVWAGSLDRSADATGYVRATPVACSLGFRACLGECALGRIPLIKVVGGITTPGRAL